MKRMALVGLVSLLTLSGAALAQQSGEQKKSSSMRGAMEQMMGGGTEDMMGMMAEMGKMMDQCTAMIESTQATAGKMKQEVQN